MNSINYLVEVMKPFPNWVGWELEDERGKPWRKESTGKCKKVPYCLHRRKQKAWINNPEHWYQYVKWRDDSGCNLGFVLRKECNLTCIDLDNKANDSSLYDLHRRILEDFSNTYIELSPSGKGIHIWCLGTFDNQLLKQQKLKHKFETLGVEFYCTSRYMTVTRNPLADHNIPLTDGIERVQKWLIECNRQTGNTSDLFPNQPKPKTNNRTISVSHIPTGLFGVVGEYANCPNIYKLRDERETNSDAEILRKCQRRATSDKFAHLYNGNWKNLGYPSQSEADQAYANIIAWYTDDPTQVARMFMHSKLSLNIDRHPDDYLWRTINTAFDEKGGAR
jgi:putative DNA primase/helicase